MWSLEVTIRTAKTPDAPIDVKVEEKSTRSKIYLSWRKGAKDGDKPVLDYTVYYQIFGTAKWILLVQNERNLETVFSLEIDQKYNFAVVARSEAGYSVRSIPYTINIQETIDNRKQYCFENKLLTVMRTKATKAG